MLSKVINVLKFFTYIKYNKYLSYLEYFKLTFLIKKYKIRKTPVVVCDLKCLPKAYGNFCQIIFLALFLGLKFNKCSFVLIKNKSISNWERVKKNKINKLLSDFRKIIFFYLTSKNITFEELTWFQYKKKYNTYNLKNFFVVYNNYINSRKSIHYLSFNLLNLFLTKKSNLKKYFLKKKKNQYLNNSFRKLRHKYLSLSARYSVDQKNSIHSKKINKNFNTSFEDLKKIILKIKKKKINKNKKIIIITSREGMYYYKKKINLNYLKYSYEYTNSFLGHVELIMNSEKYYSYGASGIIIFPLLSKLPYLISWSHEPNQEYRYSKNKYFGCQRKNQQTLFYCNLKTFLASI
jgi:hypothetical protein